MTDVNNPHPIPKRVNCPYCGELATRHNYNADTGVASYSHSIEERHKIGQASVLVLHTVHQFNATWGGVEWAHDPNTRMQTPKIMERLELYRGGHTDWESCDGKD